MLVFSREAPLYMSNLSTPQLGLATFSNARFSLSSQTLECSGVLGSARSERSAPAAASPPHRVLGPSFSLAACRSRFWGPQGGAGNRLISARIFIVSALGE